MSIEFQNTANQNLSIAAQPNQTTFTWMCWARFDVVNNFRTIWDFNSSGTEWFLINTTMAGGGVVRIDTNGFTLTFASGFNLGTWSFMAFTKDNADFNTYWQQRGDASPTTASGTDGSPNYPAGNMLIGESNFGGEDFDGDLAFVKVYSGVALTQAQIEVEQWKATPVRIQDLWAYYPFWNNSSHLRDFSNNGRDLTAGSTAVSQRNTNPIVFIPGGQQKMEFQPAPAAEEAVGVSGTNPLFKSSWLKRFDLIDFEIKI